MTKERKRKHAHVEVQGDLPVEERIPRWELELLVAAFARTRAVLAFLADRVCAKRRVEELRKSLPGMTCEELGSAWRALVIADLEVGRAHAMHLIERAELHDDRAIVVPKSRVDAV